MAEMETYTLYDSNNYNLSNFLLLTHYIVIPLHEVSLLAFPSFFNCTSILIPPLEINK